MTEEKKEEIMIDINNDNNEKYKAFVVMNGNSKIVKSKDNTLNIDKNDNEKEIIINNNDNDNDKNIKNEAIVIGHCTNQIISTSSISSISNKINDDSPNIEKVYNFLRKCGNDCFLIIN